VESIKDFIASQAEKLRNDESQAAHKRNEWVAAVDRLNQQIKAWLSDADPDHAILDVRETPYQLREEGIGSYEARGLSISVARRELRVEPIARNYESIAIGSRTAAALGSPTPLNLRRLSDV
jgi:hypothetical protein